MANTSTLVLKDAADKTIKGLGSKATLKDLAELSKKNADAVVVIEEEAGKDDPLKPVNIKVVQLTGVGKAKAEDNAGTLSGVVISLDKPADWTAATKYQVRFFDRSLNGLEPEAELVNIVMTDGANTDFGLTGGDNKLAYYYYDKAMEISSKTYKDNKLVQVRRQKADKEWSEWGTELHNDYTVGGTITIFKRPVDLSYKTGDENVGLKPGQEIKVKYSDLIEEPFAKNFPKQIFDDRPETSLAGMAIKLSKLNYNKRTKNFKLAIQVNTNDIEVDVTDDAKLLEYYKKSVDANATTVPEGYGGKIKSLKENGIELLPGFTIKEVYFEMNTNDELPNKKASE